ncbi:MAG: hypothetical protein ABEI99_07120, partial [Halobaculum sp.]
GRTAAFADAAIVDEDGAELLRGEAGEIGYRGPCPPRGDDPHTFRFTLSALSDQTEVEPGARREVLATEIQRLEITRTRLTGQFQRPENTIRHSIDSSGF